MGLKHHRRVALLSAACLLTLALFSWADEPSASLLPPGKKIAPVVPASSSSDSDNKSTKSRQRDPNFKYPPTYSSSHGGTVLPELSQAWKKVSGIRLIGSSETKPPEKTAESPPEVATPELTQVGKRSIIANDSIPLSIIPTQPVRIVQAPAWRWYGYGAPVPGSNPYAPSGVYATVYPNWYHQNGSTPGAIPRPLAPIVYPTQPAELPAPKPTNAEPPPLKDKTSLAPPVASSELLPVHWSPVEPEPRPSAGLDFPVRSSR